MTDLSGTNTHSEQPGIPFWERVGEMLSSWGNNRTERKTAKLRKRHANMSETQLREKFAKDHTCGCGGSHDCRFCGRLMLDMGLVGMRRN